MKIRVKWDTETDDNNRASREAAKRLPRIVKIPDNIPEDDVADWLSDKYGFLVFDWEKK